MEYKKSKTDFLEHPDDTELLGDSTNYKFIHPNFDLYSEHMTRFSQETDSTVIVKYTIVHGSLKGAYTHQYFNLRGLEIESFDRAQGLNSATHVSEAALQVRALAEIHEQ